MAASVTRDQRVGNVLQYEVDGGRGFCRKGVTVTVEADMQVGAALTSAGAWVDANTGAGGNTAYVLIDDRIANYTAGATPTLTVIHRGPAKIAKKSLKFDGTAVAADYTAAAAALEALDIEVLDSIA